MPRMFLLYSDPGPTRNVSRETKRSSHHSRERARERMPSECRIVAPADPRDGPQGPAAGGGAQACPWQGTGGKRLKSLDSRLRGNDGMDVRPFFHGASAGGDDDASR